MKRIPGFVTSEECKILAEWAMADTNFADGITTGGRTKLRVSNRADFDSGNRLFPITYPDTVYIIQQRIRETLGLGGCPIIEGHGKGGVVVSKTFDGGDVYAHTDPSVGDGLLGLRCNVLVSKQETGGILTVDGIDYDPSVGELHCYPVTHQRHSVSVCHGPTPRILFMFGFVLTPEQYLEFCQ